MNPRPLVVSQKLPSDLAYPLFAPGQMLQHDDLAALADYTQQITRLVMRSLFGCGVVCGLCVKATFKCNKLTVVVDPGVALDCDGNPVHVPKPTSITVDPACDLGSLDDPLWVILRGFRKCCAPRATACSPDEDDVGSSNTRERYWYEIQVRSALPECVCQCTVPDDQGGADDAGDPNAERTADSENRADPCQCAKPTLDCHQKHYAGECACACSNCTDCACEWILLARLDKSEDEEGHWKVEHRVRRFVRPVLMRDLGCQKDTGTTDMSAPGPEMVEAADTAGTKSVAPGKPKKKKAKSSSGDDA